MTPESAGCFPENRLDGTPAQPRYLLIPADIHDAMVEHCRREAPLECCGILGGVSPRVWSWHPLRNSAASQTRYDADPRDLIDAVVWLREHGSEILAIYHSHPRWQAVPSATDLRENHYGPLPRIIVSLLTEPPDLRVWQLERETYRELPWTLVESARGSPRALQPTLPPD